VQGATNSEDGDPGAANRSTLLPFERTVVPGGTSEHLVNYAKDRYVCVRPRVLSRAVDAVTKNVSR
jgi:hypothetical protein